MLAWLDYLWVGTVATAFSLFHPQDAGYPHPIFPVGFLGELGVLGEVGVIRMIVEVVVRVE